MGTWKTNVLIGSVLLLWTVFFYWLLKINVLMGGVLLLGTVFFYWLLIFQSPKPEDLSPKPGDLIVFGTSAVHHWGVYIGDDCVVHLEENVVKKSCLSDVSAESPIKINKYDKVTKFYAPDEIKAKALKEVGKNYQNHEASSESFATKMRYGLSCEGPFPDIGDLVEYQRLGYPRFGYQHWGVYVGGGEIVHLTRSPPEVNKQHIEEAAFGCRYRVNKKYDKRCSPFPQEEIVKRAMSNLGKQGYSFFNGNCEHFATKVRYGVSMCDQVASRLKPWTGL